MVGGWGGGSTWWVDGVGVVHGGWMEWGSTWWVDGVGVVRGGWMGWG